MTETAAGAVAATVEALPEWREEQMKCAIRLCVRLIGGSRDKQNLIAMCRALSLPANGSGMVLQRRLENALRERRFDTRAFQANDVVGVPRDLPSHEEATDRTHKQQRNV